MYGEIDRLIKLIPGTSDNSRYQLTPPFFEKGAAEDHRPTGFVSGYISDTSRGGRKGKPWG